MFQVSIGVRRRGAAGSVQAGRGVRLCADAPELLGVVSERLQATRLQVLDMHSPVAKRAGA